MKRIKSARQPSTGLLRLCFSKSVSRRALSTALIVGFVLNAINHGGAVVRGTVPQAEWIQILLTFCVPYGVSAYSSARAILDMRMQPAVGKTARASGDSYDRP
jgi:hypothetical protein